MHNKSIINNVQIKKRFSVRFGRAWLPWLCSRWCFVNLIRSCHVIGFQIRVWIGNEYSFLEKDCTSIYSLLEELFSIQDIFGSELLCLPVQLLEATTRSYDILILLERSSKPYVVLAMSQALGFRIAL